MELSEQTGLAITAGQYFTPSGRSIQRPLAGTALTFASLSPSAVPKDKAAKTATGTDADGPIAATFHTDDGRAVTIGGGITPDVTIAGHSDDPWLAFVTQRGYLTSYAESYLTTHGKLPSLRGLTRNAGGLQSNRSNATASAFPMNTGHKDQDFLKLRLKVELTNLVYGLERGGRTCNQGRPASPGSRQPLPACRADSQGHYRDTCRQDRPGIHRLVGFTPVNLFVGQQKGHTLPSTCLTNQKATPRCLRRARVHTGHSTQRWAIAFAVSNSVSLMITLEFSSKSFHPCKTVAKQCILNVLDQFL